MVAARPGARPQVGEGRGDCGSSLDTCTLVCSSWSIRHHKAQIDLASPEEPHILRRIAAGRSVAVPVLSPPDSPALGAARADPHQAGSCAGACRVESIEIEGARGIDAASGAGRRGADHAQSQRQRRCGGDVRAGPSGGPAVLLHGRVPAFHRAEPDPPAPARGLSGRSRRVRPAGVQDGCRDPVGREEPAGGLPRGRDLPHVRPADAAPRGGRGAGRGGGPDGWRGGPQDLDRSGGDQVPVSRGATTSCPRSSA